MKRLFPLIITVLITLAFSNSGKSQITYPIVDTGQELYYDTTQEISAPAVGSLFYGQDACYNGNQPQYTDNGDGTVTDHVTGLMWTKSYDMDGDGDIDVEDKMSYEEATAAADTFSLAGYDDWRIPSIKEVYPYGNGPQGDVIRIYNFVRLVRDAVSTGVGAIDVENNEFKIYPNPATNTITLSLRNLSDGELIVSDINGRVVLKEEITTQTQSVNVSNLLNGVYIASLRYLDEVSFGKFLIQK